MCDLTMVKKCEGYVLRLVTNWWFKYLFISLWWWFEICCIYLNNWIRIYENMILLKMNIYIYIYIYIYTHTHTHTHTHEVVILILYMHSYILYVEFISYPTCGKWLYTSLLCRLSGWGRIVDVSSPRMAWSLLIFYYFDFGVLSSGALIRMLGFNLCHWIMFEESWVHFDDVLIMRYDVWHLCY